MDDAADPLTEGLRLHQAGAPAAAATLYRRALAADPANADAHHLLGLALHAQGRMEAGLAALARARALRPAEPLYAGNLGRLHLAAGDAAAAEPLLRTAAADPAFAHDHGLALLRLGRPAEAEAALRRAHALNPHDRATAARLGNLLAERGQFDEAIALLAPFADPDGRNNLGVALTAAGRLHEAIATLDRALKDSPGHADAAYNRATALLLAGRLPEAWPGFERRWHRRGFSPPFPHPSPRWRGEPTGERLLLHAEQGFGDTIQMARFLPALAARHRLVLALPRPLHRLHRPLVPGIEIHDLAAPLPEADLHCPLMSLPAALALDLPDLPGPGPYLSAEPSATAAWAARLAPLAGLRVGLAWAGNPAYPADAARSLPPAPLATLAGLPGVSLVSLQKGAAPPIPMADWTADLGDFADTAALIANLDLVVSVDTAAAHLAGALGKPVWLLNRFAPCWRWMLGRDDSPWYPTLRQFRQPAPGDWTAVLLGVRDALAQAVSSACAANSDRSGSTPSPGPCGTWTAPAAARSTSGTTSRASA
jgi:tetratricopeptide (TPR) repeat protein